MFKSAPWVKIAITCFLQRLIRVPHNKNKNNNLEEEDDVRSDLTVAGCSFRRAKVYYRQLKLFPLVLKMRNTNEIRMLALFFKAVFWGEVLFSFYTACKSFPLQTPSRAF